MKELTEYRKMLVDRLEAAMKEFQKAALAAKAPYTPIEAGGWSVHQVAVHARDVDRLAYGLRVRRTLAEDNPEFPNFDGEAYMADNYNLKEPLRELLDGFSRNIEEQVELLRAMPAEGWSRVSRHAMQDSGLTLQIWVERGLEHLEEHLVTLKRVGEE
jgi:hypothetical protein